MSHPLDDELVVVSVSLIHVPTQLETSSTVIAETDGGLTVSEAVNQAKEAAMDDLVAQLEVVGG